MKDIERIIQSIPEEYKVLYDRPLIEQLYTQFQSRKIDDRESVQEISRMIQGRRILLLAPGKSLASAYDRIVRFIETETPYVISINFVDTRYPLDACFVSNHKRMDILRQEMSPLSAVRTILTSNIPSGGENCLYVDYDQYTNDDELVSDNAGLMLMALLKRCGATEIFLAGFDGFYPQYNENYYTEELIFRVDEDERLEKQQRIGQKIQELSQELRISFLTPSVYEQAQRREAYV